MKQAMTDNPAWANLKEAVQNNRVIYLPSKLFLLNPGLQTPEAMSRLVKEAYGINVTFNIFQHTKGHSHLGVCPLSLLSSNLLN